MDMTTEHPSALVQHPVAKKEHVIAHYLVTVSGHPKDGYTNETAASECRSILNEALIEQRREFGNRLYNAHVMVEEFSPEVFFSGE